MNAKARTMTMVVLSAVLVSGIAEASGRAGRSSPKRAAEQPKRAVASMEVGANPARINSCVQISACGFEGSAGDLVAIYQNDSMNAPGDNSGGKPLYTRLDSKGCFRLSMQTGTLPTELRLDAYRVSSTRERISRGTPAASAILHVAWDATRTTLVEHWAANHCEG